MGIKTGVGWRVVMGREWELEIQWALGSGKEVG